MYVRRIKYTPVNNSTYNNLSIHHDIQLQPCRVIGQKVCVTNPNKLENL